MTLLDAFTTDSLAGRHMTLAEFLALPDHSGYELVDGVVWEKRMAAGEAWVCGRVYKRVDDHVEAHDLGWTYPRDTVYVCFGPDNNRKLDVSFIAKDRHPAAPDLFRDLDIVPDLAVEVLSPSNTVAEIRTKLADYFAAGVRLVWIVDPFDRQVRVYTKPTDPRTYSTGDVLDGGDVLPGFACPVADLFPPVPAAAAAT